EYGVDALRYFVSREIGSFEDSPFTMERFKAAYNTNLANGLGNLVSRVMKMATTNLDKPVEVKDQAFPEAYSKALDSFDIQAAVNVVWKHITDADQLIQEKAPFKLIKTDKAAAEEILRDLCKRVYTIGALLEPIMPETAKIVQQIVRDHKMP